jgi:hypothetical protein
MKATEVLEELWFLQDKSSNIAAIGHFDRFKSSLWDNLTCSRNSEDRVVFSKKKSLKNSSQAPFVRFFSCTVKNSG